MMCRRLIVGVVGAVEHAQTETFLIIHVHDGPMSGSV